MGFRFRRRIKLFHGLWFNVSKSGISTSVGGKGLTVNFKGGKVKTTVGIPGTGISYSSTTGGQRTPAHQTTTGDPPEPDSVAAWVVVWLVVIAMAVMMFMLR